MGHQSIGRMRGEDRRSGSLFSYVDLEARVGADHPLRTIRTPAGLLYRPRSASRGNEEAGLRWT